MRVQYFSINWIIIIIIRPVCNPRKQCTSRLSGSKGGTQQIAEVCWHHHWCGLHSFCHRDLGSLGRAGLGVGIRDWSTSDINDAWTTFYNLSSPTYLGGCAAQCVLGTLQWLMFHYNDCNNLIYRTNNNNVIAALMSELCRTVSSVGFVLVFSVL